MIKPNDMLSQGRKFTKAEVDYGLSSSDPLCSSLRNLYLSLTCSRDRKIGM